MDGQTDLQTENKQKKTYVNWWTNKKTKRQKEIKSIGKQFHIAIIQNPGNNFALKQFWEQFCNKKIQGTIILLEDI